MRLGLGLTLGGGGNRGPYIALSTPSQAEGTAIGTTIGTLSVVGATTGSSGWTFAKTVDTDSAFTLTTATVKNAIVFDYDVATGGATSHVATYTATKSGDPASPITTPIRVGVTNVLEVTLGVLALSGLSYSTASSSSGSITGKTSGSTVSLSGSLPTGLTLDLVGMTWAWAGGGSVSSGSFDLVETHPDGNNSPRASTQNWTISAVTAVEAWTPLDLGASLIAYWDAYDPAGRGSVTHGNPISTLADFGPNGWDMTGAGSTRPNVDDQFLPQAAASFDGSDDVLITANATIARPFTIFDSFQESSFISPAFQTMFDAGGSVLWRPNQGGQPLVFAGSTFFPSVFAAGETHVALINYQASSGVFCLNDGSPETGSPGAGTISAAPLRTGNSALGDAPLLGALQARVIVDGNIAQGSDDANRLFSFLAWRGVYISPNKLASGNPYRYCPPVKGTAPAVPALVRHADPPMISHGGSGAWNETNIFDPNVIDDPSDATKLMMYASGQKAPVGTGEASIGLYRALKSAPFSWTFDSVVFQQSAGPWYAGAGGVRLGSIVYDAGTYYMFYCSQSGTNSLGVATSSDGVTFTDSGAALLVPTGDEISLGEPAVVKLGSGSWGMIYDYRTADETLGGYRTATASSPTGPWTKSGGADILRRPHRGLQLECHQIKQSGGLWYLILEMGGSTTEKTPYGIYVAEADAWNGPYTLKKNLLYAPANPGGGNTDLTHVATPCLFTVSGTDYLFSTGTPDVVDPYYNSVWNMYGFTVTDALTT